MDKAIERQIFISRTLETTDLDKHANKMLKNDCFIDLEVGKLCLSFLLAAISEKMFGSYVFPNKNQKPLRMSRTQITKQAVAILSLISGMHTGKFFENAQNGNSMDLSWK